MRLRSVTLAGFGVYDRPVCFRFPAGAAVLVGPNESGKSTLLHGIGAILFGLRGDSDPAALGVGRFRSFSRPKEFWGELEWEQNGARYRLHRAFASHRVRLTEEADKGARAVFEGEHNPRATSSARSAFAGHLTSLIGIGSLELFQNTFCLGQPQPEDRAIGAGLQHLLSGSRSGKVEDVLERLFDEVKALTSRTGELNLVRPGRAKASNQHTPGRIELLETELAEAHGLLERGKEVLARSNASNATLEDTQREILGRESSVRCREERAQAVAEWLKADDQRRHLSEELRLARSALGELDRIERERRALRPDLEGRFARYADAPATLAGLLENLQSRLDSAAARDLTLRLRELEVREAEREREAAVAAIGAAESAGKRRGKRGGGAFPVLTVVACIAAIAAGIAARISGVLGGAAAAVFGATLLAVLGVLMFLVDRRRTRRGRSSARAVTGERTPAPADIDPEPAATRAALRARQADLRSSDAELGPFARTTAAELARFEERWGLLDREADRLREERESLVARSSGGERARSLPDAVRTDDPRGEAADALREAAIALARAWPPAGALDPASPGFPAALAGMREEERAAASAWRKNAGLAAVQDSVLATARAAGRAEIEQRELEAGARLGEVLTRMDRFEGTDPLLAGTREESDPAARAERLRQVAAADSNALAEERAALAGARDRERALLRDLDRLDAAGAPNLALLELRVRELESEITALRRERDAIGLAFSWVREAAETFQGGCREDLEERITGRFRMLTGVADRRVAVGESFEISILGGGGQPVALEQLSQGAQDQLALAIRLAVADLLAGSHPLPLFFDDPFVHYDAGRLGHVKAALERLGRERQWVLLTHREELAAWGEPVLPEEIQQ